MQGKNPVATCPYCGSREFWPSRKRLLETLLGPILPYRPFRCRTCLKRYVRFKAWLAPALAVGLLIGLGGAALVYFDILALDERFFADSRPETRIESVIPPPTADTPAIAAPTPGPADAAPPEAFPEPTPPAPAVETHETPVSQRPDTAFTRLHLNIPPSAGERP